MSKDLQKLLERIPLRLDDSFVGIGSEVADLPPADLAELLNQLLQYPDHTAGGIMTTEFVRLDPKMSVGEALRHIRAVAQEKESMYACYPD